KNHPALFVSRDWGEMWNRQDALPEPPRRIWVDPKSSKDSRTLYIGGQHLVSIKNKTGLRNFSAPESVTFTGISLGFNSASQPMCTMLGLRLASGSAGARIPWNLALPIRIQISPTVPILAEQ